MKTFLKYLILFFGLYCILLVVTIVLSNKMVENNAKLRLGKNINYIVVGNSHSECAFNDSLIGNFKNLSQSGESYFYTYQKVKKILSQNDQLKVVFIEFSNNQINMEIENWIWGDKYMSNFYPKYAPFINAADNFLLAKNNYSSYQKNLSISIKKGLGRIIENNYDFTKQLGGYRFLIRNKTDSLVSVVESTEIRIDDYNSKISTISLSYLDKIISLCNENNKQVYLVRSPQHKYLKTLKNEKKFIAIKDSMFSKTAFLDFNDFPITNDEFGDFGHLNYKGAKKFSIWFDKKMGVEFNTYNIKKDLH